MATGYYFVSVSNFVWDFGNFNLVRNFIQINIDKINKVIQNGTSIKKKKKKKNQRITASSQWSFKVYTKDMI